jgi:predicted RNA-binding protein with PIN domain
MIAEWLVIDGNNILHAEGIRRLTRCKGGFAGLRRGLVRQMDGRLGVIAGRVTVVFDGSGDTTAFGDSRVEVVFSGVRGSADAVIERYAAKAGGAGVLVVTSDLAVRRAAEAAGVATMACDSFLETLAQEDAPGPASAPKSGATLGDFFPGVK